MIKVEHDGPEFDNMPAENCCFCWKPTRYWVTSKDVACCQKCAKNNFMINVPSKTEWCSNPKAAL